MRILWIMFWFPDVAVLMGQLDPEGCQQRKARRLQRRNYTSPGPNYVWLVKGYDKLKTIWIPYPRVHWGVEP